MIKILPYSMVPKTEYIFRDKVKFKIAVAKLANLVHDNDISEKEI